MLRSKCMVPGDGPIIAIGYKYNARKVLYFIAIADAGNIKAGIPYLSRCPYPFYNASILPVYSPLAMYKLFGSVNEVDSHNKSMQYDLVLEKFWVTQCGWLRLCTTVAMVMTITGFWKPFHYGVKRDHYDKFISIREFLEILSLYCFKNTFPADTRALAKNIPTLDEVDDGETVSTFHSLCFFSSDYCYT